MMVIRWSAFNKLGRSKIVRSSYYWAIFVPIAAKVLSAIPINHKLNIPSSSVSLVLGVPFTWELLYYSAVFFALGTLLYHVCCPEIVKAYDKYSDFSAEGKGSADLLCIVFGVSADQTQKIAGALTDQQRLEVVQRFCGKQQIVMEDVMNMRINTIGISDEVRAFSFIRNCADFQRPWHRATILILYAFGFILFGYVMLQNLWSVVALHMR